MNKNYGKVSLNRNTTPSAKAEDVIYKMKKRATTHYSTQSLLNKASLKHQRPNKEMM
ncbi:MAG: hypothetical protein ACRDBY_08695 [Cetobacterium sp.]